MAIICSTCGYQCSDDNEFCPNCGSKLSQNAQSQNNKMPIEPTVIQPQPQTAYSAPKEDDDVVRCPKCGSKNINFVTTETSSNFDKSNACCGYILLGPLGLLCGVNDKKTHTTVRKCMKCGHEF